MARRSDADREAQSVEIAFALVVATALFLGLVLGAVFVAKVLKIGSPNWWGGFAPYGLAASLVVAIAFVVWKLVRYGNRN